jgi:hypothetical protein
MDHIMNTFVFVVISLRVSSEVGRNSWSGNSGPLRSVSWLLAAFVAVLTCDFLVTVVGSEI